MATDSAANVQTGTVRVVCGPNENSFPNLAGRTIASIRASLKTPFNIAPDAQVRVSNQAHGQSGVLVTDDNTLAKEGDTIEFVRPTGQKG